MSKTYSNLHTFLCDFIERNFKDKASFPKLALIPNDDALFPNIIKKKGEIQYSYRTEILFILNNCSNIELLLNYYFCISSYNNNKFDESKLFASKIREELKNVENIKEIERDFKINKNKIVYEILFVILHEIGHGLYSYSKEYRDYFFSIVEREIGTLVETYKKQLNNPFIRLYMRLNFMLNKDARTIYKLNKKNGVNVNNEFIINFISDFNDYIVKDKKKEEVACDLFAFFQFLMIADENNVKIEDVREFFPACLNALQLISTHILLDNYFIHQQGSEKYTLVSSLDQVRIIFIQTRCEAVLAKDYPKIYNYFLKESYKGIPAVHFDSVQQFLEKNASVIREIGIGAESIDENKKKEANEFIIDAEDDILHIVERL